MGVRWSLAALAGGVLAVTAAPMVSGAGQPDAAAVARFREAGEAVRSGDYPKATAAYRELASSGLESGSLYWNWAQAAAARGATGEALWALLRGREVEPGDGAVRRDVERLREAANLDAAELAPEPLAALALLSRRFHLGLACLAALGLSIVLQAGARLALSSQRLTGVAWAAFAVGLGLAVASLTGSFAGPTGVVLRRSAPLLESASLTAESVGSLREGEVVPILSESGGYVRVEDSSGARGWASTDDVGRLDRPPRALPSR